MEDSPLIPKTQPFYWSVRRELWENRSIYMAPLAAAGVILFGFGITAFGLPQRRMNALALESTAQRAAIETSYDLAALMIMFTVFIVGFFYCLDALHGERRDRSILFWKSLPVSDLTTVLSKLFVPMVILPVITFVIVIATQFIMLLISTAVLLPSGHQLEVGLLAHGTGRTGPIVGNDRPLRARLETFMRVAGGLVVHVAATRADEGGGVEGTRITKVDDAWAIGHANTMSLAEVAVEPRTDETARDPRPTATAVDAALSPRSSRACP
jgi:hypothetical protein